MKKSLLLLFFALHTLCLHPADLASRKKLYEQAVIKLSQLNDQQLEAILNQGEIISQRYGQNIKLMIDEIPVFAKKIPITDFELLPEHIESTKNIFYIPSFCYYNVEFTSFGAWRELAMNKIVTNLVLNNECQNFALMYHWRILPGGLQIARYNTKQKLNRIVNFWNRSPQVKFLFESLQKSSNYMVLFFEYIPENTSEWFVNQFNKGNRAIRNAINVLERDIDTITTCLRNHGLYHFDGHIRNMVTDGTRIYLIDFGMATSLNFDLDPEEISFLNKHIDYDLWEIKSSITDVIAVTIAGQYYLAPKMLREYAAGKKDPIITKDLTELFKRYIPYSMLRSTFFTQLSQNVTTAQYPQAKIKNLIDNTKKWI